jgi:hypothetical protein
MKSSRFAYLATGAGLLAGTLAFSFQPAGGYHLLRKISLGAAPGGTEYFDLDPKTHNLLVDTSDFSAPATGAKNARPVATPGTFRLLVYGR